MSLSARIFGGFLVVMLAFVGVIGFTVYRMHRVRQQLELVNSRYLRLTLVLGRLSSAQDNLFNRAVAARAGGGAKSSFLRSQVRLARKYRLHFVRKARAIASNVEPDLPEHDRQALDDAREQLQRIERAVRANEPKFDQLFAAQGLPAARDKQLADDLLRSERKLLEAMRRLHEELRGQVQQTAVQVEADQQASVWAGLALVVLALLVSATVTFRARRRLGPLTTLVQGTKRIASGDYAGRVRVSSDDELGLLASEFNAMAAAVQEREQRLIRSERLAAAGRLASHITHEVRNPLNSISLNTELLEEELAELPAKAAEEARALCRAVRKEVDRLTEITEEYLRFARLPKPALEEEDVNEIVSGLISFTASELAKQGVRCETRLANELPPVQADENQLRQALLNLVRNAGEAMSAASGGQLTISTGVVDRSVEIVVADDGPGIDQRTMQQIFDPFFSTKERGTGLGLALTQQIVQEHGGAISVRSEPARGTTFVVSLPVAGAHDKVTSGQSPATDEAHR